MAAVVVIEKMVSGVRCQGCEKQKQVQVSLQLMVTGLNCFIFAANQGCNLIARKCPSFLIRVVPDT
jgi:hypothetical protein